MKNFLIIIVLYFSINRLTKFLKESSYNLKVAKKMDFLFLLRPITYLFIWLVLCIGMYIPNLIYDNIQLFIKDFNFNTFMFFISVTLFCVFYLVNDQLVKVNNSYLLKKKYDDVFLDKMKKISFLLSVLLMVFVCWPLIFILILFYLLSNKLFYAIKKISIKYVFYQLFSIVLLLYLGVYYQLYKDSLSFSLDILIFSIPYILTFISIYIIHFNNFINDVTFLSIKNISFTSLFFNSIALLLSLFLQDPLSSTILTVIIFFNLYTVFRGKEKDFLRTVRYGLGILIFFVLIVYPMLLIPSLILFYISKYYYWHRFDIHFPTFLVTKNTYCPLDLNLKGKK